MVIKKTNFKYCIFFGNIKDDGTVENSSLSTIGYAKGIKKEWAAVVYFFFKLD
ncbi:5-fold beta-flower protein [Chryseobacterium sp. StRB126]|uniref:5-fold beta-flower protein n=1 Tax=Chryseobacterium sp. StRB126 TaxID=878220 RepID=UPI003977AE51